MFWIVVISAVILDRLSKFLVVRNMSLGQFIGLGNTGIGIRYVQNTGAAFSFFSNRTGFLVMFTAVLMLGIVYYYLKFHSTMTRMEQFFLALILGGGIGNFIDRAVQGYVVDFLDIRVLPVFNVADICITCGCLLFFFVVFYSERGK